MSGTICELECANERTYHSVHGHGLAYGLPLLVCKDIKTGNTGTGVQTFLPPTNCRGITPIMMMRLGIIIIIIVIVIEKGIEEVICIKTYNKLSGE